MEKTLDTVLRSIGNPSMTSGMVSRSPSPSGQATQTQALLDSPSPPAQAAFPPQASSQPVISSPKLHALPDNSLNPLGLLAEASLANRKAQGVSSSFTARPTDPDPDRRLGVASDNYFRPGSNHTTLIHSANYKLRSDDNSTSATVVHREANSARNVEFREHRGSSRVVQDVCKLLHLIQCLDSCLTS